MLNIKDNQRELNSTKPNKRILQVERGEILHREDLKYGFAYALVALTATVVVAGVGYIFVQQIRK